MGWGFLRTFSIWPDCELRWGGENHSRQQRTDGKSHRPGAETADTAKGREGQVEWKWQDARGSRVWPGLGDAALSLPRGSRQPSMLAHGKLYPCLKQFLAYFTLGLSSSPRVPGNKSTAILGGNVSVFSVHSSERLILKTKMRSQEHSSCIVAKETATNTFSKASLSKTNSVFHEHNTLQISANYFLKILRTKQLKSITFFSII